MQLQPEAIIESPNFALQMRRPTNCSIIKIQDNTF